MNCWNYQDFFVKIKTKTFSSGVLTQDQEEDFCPWDALRPCAGGLHHWSYVCIYAVESLNFSVLIFRFFWVLVGARGYLLGLLMADYHETTYMCGAFPLISWNGYHSLLWTVWQNRDSTPDLIMRCMVWNPYIAITHSIQWSTMNCPIRSLPAPLW